MEWPTSALRSDWDKHIYSIARCPLWIQQIHTSRQMMSSPGFTTAKSTWNIKYWSQLWNEVEHRLELMNVLLSAKYVGKHCTGVSSSWACELTYTCIRWSDDWFYLYQIHCIAHVFIYLIGLASSIGFFWDHALIMTVISIKCTPTFP